MDEPRQETFTGGFLPPFIRKNLKLIAILAAAAVVLSIPVFFVGRAVYRAGVISEANTQESNLEGVWLSNHQILDECIRDIRQAAGIAQQGAREINGILTNAISARYPEGDTQASRASIGTAFQVLVERYPETGGISASFDRVMVIAVGCNKDFTDAMKGLITQGKTYEGWTRNSTARRWFGPKLPTNDLEVEYTDLQGQKVTAKGKEALKKITTPVVSVDAKTAFGTNERPIEDPFAPPTTVRR